MHILAALLAGMFVVDWVYMIYHIAMENPIYREANFYASTPLYFMAGVVWLYRGSLKALWQNLRKIKKGES